MIPLQRRICNRRCLSMCLSATLRKNFPTDLHEIFIEGWQWDNEQMIKFLWRSVSRIPIPIRIRIATLVRRALAEVCTVPVLLVLFINVVVHCRCDLLTYDWLGTWTLHCYFAPGRDAVIAISVSLCLSVCLSVRSHISKSARPDFTKFSVHVSCGRGSVLLCRQCNTLCTSGFVDDVIFSHNRVYAVYDEAYDRWM